MTIKTWENIPPNYEVPDDPELHQTSPVVFPLLATNANRTQELRHSVGLLPGRRRTIARMIRVELEITIGLLNKALTLCN